MHALIDKLRLKGKDLSFLKALPFLEGFNITDRLIDDISPIHELHHLRYLAIYTYCKTEIDFLQFPVLENCVIEWRPKAKSIFNCKTLKELFINCYKGKDTNDFGNLTNLEWLAFGNGPVRSLNGLSTLRKLKHLEIFLLRKLESLEGLEDLTSLEYLDVNTCKAITSIEPVRHLVNLKTFFFNNCGDIESLTPLAELEHLKDIWFAESTNILDGDLSPLKRLNLKRKSAFKNRKHYSHTTDDFC